MRAVQTFDYKTIEIIWLILSLSTRGGFEHGEWIFKISILQLKGVAFVTADSCQSYVPVVLWTDMQFDLGELNQFFFQELCI